MLKVPEGFARGLLAGGIVVLVGRAMADRRSRSAAAGLMIEVAEATPIVGSRVHAFFAGQLMSGIYRSVAEDVVSEARSGELMELESGPGFLAVEIAQRARNLRITAMDMSPHMVQMAEARIHGAGVGRQAKVAHGDAADIPFPDGSFDFLLSLGALHRWRAPSTVLSEIHRVLRPGGRAWIYDLRREMPEDGWELVRRKAPLLTRLLLDVNIVASWRAAYTEGQIGALVARSPFGRARTGALSADVVGVRVPALTRVVLER